MHQRLTPSQGKKRPPAASAHFARRRIEITSRQQQTRRALLGWLQGECEIERPGKKPLAVAELESDTWVGEVKRIRGKNLPLTAAGFTEQTFSIQP